MSKHRVWLSWAAVAILGFSCCGLVILQYRSINEITAAERIKMYQDLQDRMKLISQGLNEEISGACFALIPTSARIEEEGRERAYAERYLRWRGSHGEMFRRIGLAVPRNVSLVFLQFDETNGRFTQAEWPSNWTTVLDYLTQGCAAAADPDPSGTSWFSKSPLRAFPERPWKRRAGMVPG